MTTETSRMKPKSGCVQTPGSRFFMSRVAEWPKHACSNAMLHQEIQACGRRVVAVGECGLDYWKNYDEPLISTRSQSSVALRNMCLYQFGSAFQRGLKSESRALKVFNTCRTAANVERFRTPDPHGDGRVLSLCCPIRSAYSGSGARLLNTEDFNLPVVVHARDADDDTMHVLKSTLPRQHKVYIHAFQGGTEFLEEALKIFPNCIFGVSSMVWCSEGAERITKNCPLDRMVLETDAPYLAPHPSEP